MPYLIVDKESHLIVSARNGYRRDRYATLAAAKAGATRLVKKGELEAGSFVIYDAATMPKKTHKVANFLTGELVEEDINLPYHCSVSSETYWST